MKRLFYLLFGLVLLPALLYAQGTLSLKDINDNLTNNYYTKTVSDSKYGTTASVALKADKTYVDANFATTAENALKQNIADMVDYYTKTAADLLLADKADTDSVYTKTAADILLGLKADLTYVNGTDETIMLDDDSQDVQIEANRVAITLKATQIDMDSAEAVIQNILADNDSQDVQIESNRVAITLKADSEEIHTVLDTVAVWLNSVDLRLESLETNIISLIQPAIDIITANFNTIEIELSSISVAINNLDLRLGAIELILAGGSSGEVLTKTDDSFTWATIPSGVTDHTLLSNIGTKTHLELEQDILDLQANPAGISRVYIDGVALPTGEVEFVAGTGINLNISGSTVEIESTSTGTGATAIEDVGTYIESNTTWEFDDDYDTTAVLIYRNRLYQPRSLFTTVDVSGKTRVVFSSAINASDEIILISK